jgi:FAD/FMN-containing dehydrogenase
MNMREAAPGNQRREVRVRNFGGNVNFVASRWYAPRTEEEVLELLNRHSGAKIRVAGSLHSWSDAVVSEDVLLDMRHFDQVEIARGPDGQWWATVGSGCTIQRLLKALHQDTEATLPTLGVIKKQTIAGAISTGTHGSGSPSLSHYVEEIRAAAYDPVSGRAKTYCWNSGEGLRAARCALGCMGVILSVKIRCTPKYYVSEAIVPQDTLEEVLAGEERFPLQQFILLPYSWKYFVYRRQVVDATPQSRHTPNIYWARATKLVSVDIFQHLVLKLLLLLSSSQKGSSKLIGWFYRGVFPPLVGRKRSVVDYSENAITMRHDMFRHLEMEVFVPAEHLPRAVEMIRAVVSIIAGFSTDAPEDVARELSRAGRLDELLRLKGQYTHHYPIFFRHVLKDDTLISMSSGAKDSYYSISFFTYLKPESRKRFYQFANFLAECMTSIYEARLHWGKYNPLTFAEVKESYPHLGAFRRWCTSVDPKGVFQNGYTQRVLGFRHS